MSQRNQIVIGMDIARHVFHLATINRNSKLVENKRLRGSGKLDRFTVGESRRLLELSHETEFATSAFVVMELSVGFLCLVGYRELWAEAVQSECAIVN